MSIKTFASAIALTSAMLFGGAAYAQTMIGSMEVSADDLPAVQQRCDAPALSASTESLSTTTDTTAMTSGSDNTAETTAGSADATTTTSPEKVNEVADASTKIDLETITLEQCKTAGLIK